ncbi:DUF2157 domain-containing protein [Ferrimonas gelatinilytica]|uniref:DUF2157 domain-containing protein n=1 Tax=Ferrimonas gelatinilytica TaxID=1255257 RepID=A0ABP9SE59_9GAMM
MKVSKREGETLDKAIAQWRNQGVISEPLSQQLKASYQVTTMDWERVAKYAFWLAIACIVTALFSLLADRWLMSLFTKLFEAPDSVKCLLFALLSSILYFIGLKRRRRQPEKRFSNEAILFLGVATTAIAIGFFGRAIDTGSDHFSLLLLISALVYGLLGLVFPSKLVWIFSLMCLGSWFGAETGYLSGWGAYYLGMNYPLRFVLFGLVLVFGGTYLFRRIEKRQDFIRPTRAVGLLYLFIALWILSIFGNYGSLERWEGVEQSELLHWSLLFAVAAIGALVHGVKQDDAMTRGFGITFLFINLYTRFFEYFWDSTHKAIFFAILALSFWFLGSRAEKIWRLTTSPSRDDAH